MSAQWSSVCVCQDWDALFSGTHEGENFRRDLAESVAGLGGIDVAEEREVIEQIAALEDP